MYWVSRFSNQCVLGHNYMPLPAVNSKIYCFLFYFNTKNIVYGTTYFKNRTVY